MKKKFTATALTIAVMSGCWSSEVFASGSEMEQIKQQIKQLTYENQQLVKRIAELDQQMRRTAVVGEVESEEAKDEGLLSYINDHVNFSGAIEVEAGWSEDFEGVSESSVDLATAEFAFEAEIAAWALGTIAIEWDGDEDKLTVDEAFIALGGTEKFPTYVQAGRYVVPFGVYDGNTVSDPLTTEAFETKEDAVMVGSSFGPVSFDVYAYNGDTNEGGDESNVEQFGAVVGYVLETDGVEIEAHLGYSSSIVDSDTLQEELDPEADYVDGVAIQASVRAANAVLIGEYITAIDDYEPVDESVTSKPAAFQIEAGYNIDLGGFPSLVALAYSGSSDLGGILPKSRWMAVFGIELSEGLGVNLEYANDTDYDVKDGGTGEKADSVIAQLYYEF